MWKNFSYLMALVLILSLMSHGTAFAETGFLTPFKTKYQASYKAKYPGQAMKIAGCTLCHTSPPALNLYGAAYRKSGRNFNMIGALDSDGDGFTNLTEIMAYPETYPGNKASHPDNIRPVVKAFTVVAKASPPNTAKINLFTVTDNLKVTGYKLTTTATAPKAGAKGWTASKPRTYTFYSAGSKKLYAWAKDAAGNVSRAKVARVKVAAAPIQAAAPFTEAEANLIPLPLAGVQTEFSYAPAEDPSISSDPATAMPIAVGPVAEGGDTVNLEASFAQFAGPVDVYLYLTLSATSGETDDQPIRTYIYNASANKFELISGNVVPWRFGVVELNEKIWDTLPVSEFSPGNYNFTLEVTPTGQRQHDSHYTWTTYFTIP